MLSIGINVRNSSVIKFMNSQNKIKMRALIVCFVVIICEAPRCRTSYVKRWIQNDNFDGAGNWEEGRVPCSNQRAVFPEEIEGVVMLPIGTSKLAGMVLPVSGELLLPSDGELVFDGESNQNENSCPSGDKHFKRLKRWYWLDPQNWELVSSDQGKESWYSFPDAEKIPCENDVAVFDGDSSFEVELSAVAAYQISGIQINGVDLYGNDWYRFLNSEMGGRMFRDSESSAGGYDRNSLMRVIREPCTNPSGCLCHSSSRLRPLLMQQIKRVTKCPEPKCVRPIKPIGNVCEICGAALMFDFVNENSFKLEDFRKKLGKLVQDTAKSGVVIAYASKVTDNLDATVQQEKHFIQVVLTDGVDYNERSIVIANEIENKINNGNFGLRAIRTFRSGHYYDPNGPYTAPWIVLSTLLAVCTMLGIIYYVYVGPKARGFGLNINRPQFGIPNMLPAAARRSFLFARFDNTSNDGGAVDLAACAASEHSVASSLCDMEDAFDNASYSPNLLQEASERAVATFSELKRREQEDLLKQEDLMALDEIEE